MIKIKNCILTTQSLTCLVPHWKFIVTSWDLTRDWHHKHFLQEHSPMYAMQGLLTPLRRAQSICARQYTKSWVVLGTRQRWERQQTSHSIAIVPPDQPRYGRCFVEFASTAICTQRQNISWSALKRITEWSWHGKKHIWWANTKFTANLLYPAISNSTLRMRGLMASLEGVICTSNGSFKDALGTACFTILGPSATGSIICPMIVPGGKEVKCIPIRISSTIQSNGYDHALCKTHCARHKGTERRKNILRRTLGHQPGNIVDPSMQQLDIVAAIRTLKNKYPITWMNFKKDKHAEKGASIRLWSDAGSLSRSLTSVAVGCCWWCGKTCCPWSVG